MPYIFPTFFSKLLPFKKNLNVLLLHSLKNPTKFCEEFKEFQSIPNHFSQKDFKAFQIISRERDYLMSCELSLNSVQKFIEMQDWLLLTFSICLHNQLSSFDSIIVQMSEKRDFLNR